VTDSLEAGKTTRAGNGPCFSAAAKSPLGVERAFGVSCLSVQMCLLAERPALQVVNLAPFRGQSWRMGHASLGPLSLCQVPSPLSPPYLKPFLMNPSLTMKVEVCGLEFGNYLGVEKMIDD